MLKHEFGIMPKAPGPGERFDCYEPKKYRCVSVPDEAIEPLLKAFRLGKTYWHTLDRPELGLAYYGITLIPPETLDTYLEIVWKKPDLTELAALFTKARASDSYVIHFEIWEKDMAKKRKKIRRPQTPPLSWVDKAIYGALVLVLLAGMVLAIVLMNALREKIAYQGSTALAFRGRLDYLWLFPFFTHLAFGCAVPLTVAHEEGQPIFGNKRITYGEQPWQKDLFPLFGPQHRKIEARPTQRRYTGLDKLPG